MDNVQFAVLAFQHGLGADFLADAWNGTQTSRLIDYQNVVVAVENDGARRGLFSLHWRAFAMRSTDQHPLEQKSSS